MKKRLLAKLILMLVLISYISTFASADQRMDTSTYVPSNHTSIDTESSATTEQVSKQEPYVENGVLMCSCGIPYSKHLERSHTDDIGINAYKCDCGGNIRESRIPGPWKYTHESKECQHKKYGHDYKMVRDVIVVYECIQCAYVDSITTQDSKWECRGWDY
ncbi:hypothetical protein DW1_0860 [Proteiniborus sp. DW1]|uniref:hypothetical protein n=1 Tax=Proteiniborus sp. DW1 TaxID=1889883 RepID=UPI00092E1C91|nr:hypothetical protein [Proteiniborus sp. DW1]SCG82468.1 hypothetical protein DW1_0860 [Proteiniborus sp. DW1]